MIYEDTDLVVSLRRSACTACEHGVPSIEGTRCIWLRDDSGRLDPVEHGRRILEKSPSGCPKQKWLDIKEA